MHAVHIPAPLYIEAQHVAAASGLSVEAYVQEALQLHLEQDAPVRLTPEQAAIIATAEADIDAGNLFTADQMREYYTQKKPAWTQSRPA